MERENQGHLSIAFLLSVMGVVSAASAMKLSLGAERRPAETVREVRTIPVERAKVEKAPAWALADESSRAYPIERR